MNATQKILYIEAQIKAVIDGRTTQINCPFCHGVNYPPSVITNEESPICCHDFAAAQEAAILKLETDYHLDQAARIADNVSKMVN